MTTDTPLPTLRIAGWTERYENSRSRQIKDLNWVAVPNSHDGEGFALVMEHPQGAAIFSAWILILQVASKSSRRGVLVRENGIPHTAESLARKTRGNVEWFRLAIEFLSSPHVGWLEFEPECGDLSPERHSGDTPVTPDCQGGDTPLSGDCQEGDIERKGKKGKKEGKETRDLHWIFERWAAMDGYDSLCEHWPRYQQHRRELGANPYSAAAIPKLMLLYERLAPPGLACRLLADMVLMALNRNWMTLPEEVAIAEAARMASAVAALEPGPWVPNSDWHEVRPGVWEHLATGEVREAVGG